jgi:hypothetical protein
MKTSDRKFGLSGYTLDAFFDKIVRTYAGRPALATSGESPFATTKVSSFLRSGKRTLRIPHDRWTKRS